MEFNIPQPLKLEHEDLHSELAKATKESGKTGEAARSLARIMHPHFVKEEEYALPPLGLLTHLIKGEASREMKHVLKMTDTLKAELPQMLEEHQAIVDELKNLADAAREEGKTEYIIFSRKLTLHAETEEQVLYPAALLVGEYLKIRF